MIKLYNCILISVLVLGISIKAYINQHKIYADLENNLNFLSQTYVARIFEHIYRIVLTLEEMKMDSVGDEASCTNNLAILFSALPNEVNLQVKCVKEPITSEKRADRLLLKKGDNGLKQVLFSITKNGKFNRYYITIILDYNYFFRELYINNLYGDIYVLFIKQFDKAISYINGKEGRLHKINELKLTQDVSLVYGFNQDNLNDVKLTILLKDLLFYTPISLAAVFFFNWIIKGSERRIRNQTSEEVKYLQQNLEEERSINAKKSERYKTQVISYKAYIKYLQNYFIWNISKLKALRTLNIDVNPICSSENLNLSLHKNLKNLNIEVNNALGLVPEKINVKSVIDKALSMQRYHMLAKNIAVENAGEKDAEPFLNISFFALEQVVNSVLFGLLQDIETGNQLKIMTSVKKQSVIIEIWYKASDFKASTLPWSEENTVFLSYEQIGELLALYHSNLEREITNNFTNIKINIAVINQEFMQKETEVNNNNSNLYQFPLKRRLDNGSSN